MIPFQRMSIHNKLSLALGGATLLAFAVAGAALALFGSFTLEGRARQIIEPYAHLVSVGAEAAVAFEDPGRAREILNTLRANPQILEAEIVLRDGRLLAGYGSRSNATFRPNRIKPDGVYLNDNTAELMQSLPDGAHLRLVMGLDELNRQTRNNLLVFAAGVLVLLMATTLGLRAALQRTIVRPISTLAETVEQVRSLADYQQRVPASGADEVARLGRSFNAMMRAIQERNNDLGRLTLFQRTLLDNVAYGIVSTSPDGIVSSFNPAAERLLGYTAGEVVGKQTPACWHDPEEIARRALRLSEELGETIPSGFDVFVARPQRNLPEENEWTFIRKDGTHVPVLLSVTALRDNSGRITGFVGLTYDLTERKRAEEALKKSEEKYRSIFQNSPLAIFRSNADGNLLDINNAYEKMFGYDFVDEALMEIQKKGAEKYSHPEDRKRIMAMQLASTDTTNLEIRLRNKEGKEFYANLYQRTIFDTQGRPIFFDGIIEDISERKWAEEEICKLNDELRMLNLELEERVAARTNDLEAKRIELEENQRALTNIVEDLNLKTEELENANSKLLELDRLKSMFIASMSHELRTPLNSIIGFSSIILDEWLGPVNPEQKENLDTIKRAGKYLLSLINDVIDVSKIEAGMIEARFEEFDLYDLLTEAVQFVEKDIHEKGLKLTLQIQHQQIRTDKRRLLQCLINLLSNAAKFTEKGEIAVLSSIADTRPVESGGWQSLGTTGQVIISVRDTGIGIAEYDIPRLFKPFIRLESSLKTATPGTGLGLYLTRKLIVEVLCGDIVFTSNIDKGSTFTLIIPERIDEKGTDSRR